MIKKITALIAVVVLLLAWTEPVLANMTLESAADHILVQDYKSQDFTLEVIPLDDDQHLFDRCYQHMFNSEKNMMDYSFLETPHKFKVELKYSNGEKITSNDLECSKDGIGRFILNARTGKIYQIKGIGSRYYFDIEGDFFKLVLVCLIVTLIVELILALLFKIKPIYLILGTNILTQAFIHAITYIMMYILITQMFDLVIYVAEALIVLVEYLIYRKFAKYKDQTTLLVYCLFANGVTFGLGFLLE